MSLLAVELSDAGIIAQRGSAAARSYGPGVALVHGSSVLVGPEAAARARLEPRRVHDSYWQELGTEPLRRPFPSRLSTADLAHAQLLQIHDGENGDWDGALLSLPGTFTEAQLGLVLGIAKSAGLPVVGMVDSAVAAAATLPDPSGTLLHLDLQLHRTVVSELSASPVVERRRIELDDRAGLRSLHDRWAREIAADFVRSTRFDPLHLADTEQRLYDDLPHRLSELCASPTTAHTMTAAGRQHTTELDRARLVAAAGDQYERIEELLRPLLGGASGLLMSHRAAGLPALRDRLSEHFCIEVTTLPESAAVAGALGHASQIRAPGESLPFVTRLAISEDAETTLPPAAAIEGAGAVAGEPPTHAVIDGVAHLLGPGPFTLGVAIAAGSRGCNLSGATAGISRSHCTITKDGERVVVEDHSTYGSFVNGERIEGSTELHCGDRLRLGTPGIELVLIRVLD